MQPLKSKLLLIPIRGILSDRISRAFPVCNSLRLHLIRGLEEQHAFDFQSLIQISPFYESVLIDATFHYLHWRTLTPYSYIPSPTLLTKAYSSNFVIKITDAIISCLFGHSCLSPIPTRSIHVSCRPTRSPCDIHAIVCTFPLAKEHRRADLNSNCRISRLRLSSLRHSTAHVLVYLMILDELF